MESYLAEYRRHLDFPLLDAETKAELLSLEGKDEELAYRFSGFLSFGTAGLRGIMGAGTNMMNVYTVSHATQGLAEYILRRGLEARGVVIAHDNRLNSRRFAEASAAVLAANGIKVYLFDSLRPTPVLSFAIRYLNCIAGINITASHNPKEYNGYKAYWEDGAQLAPEQADEVSEVIRSTDILTGVKTCNPGEAIADGRIEIIGKDVDEAYLKRVGDQLVDPAVIKANSDLKIVYTPLHGTGAKFVPEILRRVGFENIITVPEQMEADGNFPTVTFPNPEFPEVFGLGKKLAEENGSDLMIATDPDADRVGIMARRKDGSFTCLTGNQTGALLLDYIITAFRETGTMPDEPYAVKSIVSTELATRICEANGVKMFNVLTGFKFIGEVIKQHEAAGHGSFLFGFEESYGYLKGTYARDKDAVVASMLIAEMAAHYRSLGMTLCDALDALYEKYGYSREKVVSLTIKGFDAADKMKALMEGFRSAPFTEIAGEPVKALRDYRSGKITELKTGAVSETGLPSSDVLYYETEGGDVIVIRPSGTEPKVKFYYLVAGATAEAADAKVAEYAAFISEKVG